MTKVREITYNIERYSERGREGKIKVLASDQLQLFKIGSTHNIHPKLLTAAIDIMGYVQHYYSYDSFSMYSIVVCSTL